MTQYRKKPVVIEAVPIAEVLAANDRHALSPELPDWVTEALEAQVKPVAGRMERVLVPVPEHEGVNVQTAEGVMFGGFDDWLIRGVKGELYPCKPDIFEATYERPDLPVNGDLEDLLATTDGMTWAAKFVEQFKGLVVDGTVIDGGLMVTWFANAIETGRRAGEEGKVTGEKLRERIDEAMVAFQPSDRITDLGAKAYHDELVSSVASAIEQPEQP